MTSNNSASWTVHVYLYKYSSVNRYTHGSILVYVQLHIVECSDIPMDPCMFIYAHCSVFRYPHGYKHVYLRMHSKVF